MGNYRNGQLIDLLGSSRMLLVSALQRAMRPFHRSLLVWTEQCGRLLVLDGFCASVCSCLIHPPDPAWPVAITATKFILWALSQPISPWKRLFGCAFVGPWRPPLCFAQEKETIGPLVLCARFGFRLLFQQ